MYYNVLQICEFKKKKCGHNSYLASFAFWFVQSRHLDWARAVDVHQIPVMQDGGAGADPVLDVAHRLCGVQTPHGAAIRHHVLSPSAAEDATPHRVGLEGALAVREDSLMESLVESILD